MPALSIDSQLKMPSGYAIPMLGFGAALDAGYRHIDSATGYSNEKESAAPVRRSKIPRDQIFFTSKQHKISYEDVKAGINDSLRESGLDYLDLYLLHAPYGGPEGRIGAWKALVEAVEAGKVRSIGVSNYGVHHLEELEAYIKETDAREGKGKGGVLSVNQVELHPWLARPDIVKWCKDRGVVLEAYCPIVRGEKANDETLQAIAKKHCKTWAQVLIRWSLQMGFVPLPKSVTPERIKANADVFDFELDAEDMRKLDTGKYEPVAWDPTTRE